MYSYMYIYIFMYISVISMHIYKYVSKLHICVYIIIYIVPVPSQNNHWIILDIYILIFCLKNLFLSNNNNISIGEVETNEQLIQLEQNDSTEDIVHFSWTQVNNNKDSKYKDTDILIDTGSTFSVFKYTQMLLNIKESAVLQVWLI